MPKNAKPLHKSAHQKHTKRTVILLASVFLLVLVPTTALAYVGFVPGATELLGTNTPVDLGVSYNAADFANFQKKTLSTVGNFAGGNPAPGPKLVISGADSIQADITQSELTAFLNETPWTGSPLSHSQIRFGNGTVEFSGNIRSAYVSDLLRSLYPNGDNGQYGTVMSLAGHLHNPAVYLKANISATNVSGGPAHGQLHLKVLALKVNRNDLSSKVSGMHEITVTIPEGSYAQATPYSVSSVTTTDGSVNLYGTVPATYSVGSGDPGVICQNFHGVSLVSLDAVDGHIGSVVKSCQ